MQNTDFLLKPGDNSQSIRSSILKDILVGILCAIFIIYFVGQSYIIVGPSMEPTLFSGDRVIAEKISYYFHQPKRFDIVIFKEPTSKKTLVKRVIGLPGETINFKAGQTYVDNKPITEAFIKNMDSNFNGKTQYVPENYIFVMGDNRPISRDSRYFEAIPIENIKGRAFIVYWKNARLLHQ